MPKKFRDLLDGVAFPSDKVVIVPASHPAGTPDFLVPVSSFGGGGGGGGLQALTTLLILYVSPTGNDTTGEREHLGLECYCGRRGQPRPRPVEWCQLDSGRQVRR